MSWRAQGPEANAGARAVSAPASSQERRGLISIASIALSPTQEPADDDKSFQGERGGHTWAGQRRYYWAPLPSDQELSDTYGVQGMQTAAVRAYPHGTAVPSAWSHVGGSSS